MYYVTKELSTNKELRKLIDKNINFKEYAFSEETKESEKQTRNNIVGSAFEILFQVERLKYTNKEFRKEFMKFFRGYTLLINLIGKTKEDDKIKSWIKNADKAIKIIEDYLEEKLISDKKLIKAILFLDFISLFREPKQIYYYEPKYSKNEMFELINLKKNIKNKIFKKCKKALFNYGISYGLLAGEIDILLEDSFYDIKTTNYPIFSRDFIYQLIMYYYLLTRRGYKVDKTGIFFSKFKKIEKIKFKELFKKNGMKKIFKYMDERYFKKGETA